MFLGHIAVGLAAKRAQPRISLASWVAAVQLVDLIWPAMLLAGLEHVRIAPGITPFTPLDFYDYPITHSLVGGAAWAAAFALLWSVLVGARWPERSAARSAALLLAFCVLSHWLLDVASHRPDMPVLPHGPYIGLGLWYSIPATLLVELTMFGAGVVLYVRSGAAGARRAGFWILVAFLLAAYFAASFGPPPPSVKALAWSALSMWLLVPWIWWVDRA